jgi:hypothetical protein
MYPVRNWGITAALLLSIVIDTTLALLQGGGIYSTIPTRHLH